ncbi:hypothetical protein DSO57_1006176 [Entomophthora muscae]|uniref:Uncharacterized protein n=1 Tax=Entomophthora muscae TaxID=34485 RepID=A0ACC2RMD6_9FUNG|nr:hypothetical protein DSO57_1006176 [Entomophthora muscae]
MKASLSGIKKYFNKILLQIHPDFFSNCLEAKKVNEAALARLQTIFKDSPSNSNATSPTNWVNLEKDFFKLTDPELNFFCKTNSKLCTAAPITFKFALDDVDIKQLLKRVSPVNRPTLLECYKCLLLLRLCESANIKVLPEDFAQHRKQFNTFLGIHAPTSPSSARSIKTQFLAGLKSHLLNPNDMMRRRIVETEKVALEREKELLNGLIAKK